jgi:hypothetical protein
LDATPILERDGRSGQNGGGFSRGIYNTWWA